ncbi:hypothetical protein OEW28_18510 [Defluviimonas sp. WL0002]|uniref:Uncharacterized protein n=1 Tax=Albidovulum marisflavi TaxID=2984159 RepID=A0ABT2ZHJ6_9RHOB|nr:hypothetical protein [Defluviimonas sp. WL0002]MCV2870609.1 hypothetical protein [Defluviimonas sp. WL0002]
MASGSTLASGARSAAAVSSLGAALAALGQTAPGVGIGIRLVGYDDRTRRLGNPALNTALSAGRRFDDCEVLAELRNGQSYKLLSVLLDAPAERLCVAERIGLVATGLEVLSHLDSLGAASVAA